MACAERTSRRILRSREVLSHMVLLTTDILAMKSDVYVYMNWMKA